MTKPTFAALALACLSFSVYAQDDLYSERFSACMENSGGVTVEMLDCIGDEHAVQDQRLNQAYKRLISQLSVSREHDLRAAQRLWIQYRDANCSFYADPDGGAMASIRAADCGLGMTARRARELEYLQSDA